ncbi:hypothetical protein HanXRQr2_Chr16g0756271 [Helianthus annuus]|uniref:Uncharacterized protein n=1 Tax=Helianthus annuus TaxID=4232 RepID=A0A251S075_HELAN|nr:hypothetical protein HanXRQr2_Chr16g0756271 [Helianthus annuus]KAJ0438674.1 hypothetical protein HanHA300_Chr16g0616741 [Helianthus annuus]KAJ0461022.1 hypothetical protein HanHA89_Chr16g0667601 [Helianthus annuus]KAJ0641448.1 hypothetical protein HanLR1_Chr16g0627321 [Helianthus annuus]KAJ0645342.1 hypothetical protein HanOQP8_Chr16g0622821 [Helianthus annuus]
MLTDGNELSSLKVNSHTDNPKSISPHFITRQSQIQFPPFHYTQAKSSHHLLSPYLVTTYATITTATSTSIVKPPPSFSPQTTTAAVISTKSKFQIQIMKLGLHKQTSS